MATGLIQDDDGFYDVTCICGWFLDGLPDEETAIDALMEHAYGMGHKEERHAGLAEARSSD